jgi:hypothetical protein
VTFYVGKQLAHGPIRFGVSPRSTVESIDDDAGLSTGPAGEFLKKRTTGFYFGDTRKFLDPVFPSMRSITGTSFLDSLKPDGTTRGYAFLGMMALGLLLILWGFLVIRNLGPQGWLLVSIGLGLIIAPLFMTAQKRAQLKAQEEREKAEREERQKKERQMLAAYIDALERVRRSPNEKTLDRVAFERQGVDLPYEIWAPYAKHTVLMIGFAALGEKGPRGSKEVHDLMTRAATAVGLTAADDVAVKLDLYRVLVWHLLADDRLGETQSEELLAFRKGFGIWDRDVPVESKAAEEFKKLRGITTTNLPRKGCPRKLTFHEYCVLATRGSLMQLVKEKRGEKWAPKGARSVYVTNKRVIVDAGRKMSEIPLPKIDDVEVDMDQNILTIRTGGGLKPVTLQVEDPIYTAALIDIATNIDERPKGFA